jgi:Raf kinase inhibitor-like YbhB/YbcL family protein
MRLTSVFRDGADIPSKYTCDGANVSPPLAWDDVPQGTRSLAIVVDDPDAPSGTWVHWIVSGLSPEAHGLPEGVHLHDRVGKNDWELVAWGGPCPPSGKHHYVFKLYALDRELALTHPTKAELEREMAGHVLAEAHLVGRYQRRPS